MSTSSLAASSVEDLADIGRNLTGVNSNAMPDLETRLRSLSEVDRKIYEIVDISKEILLSFDKERQLSRSKMEELFKKYEKCVEDINNGLGVQLNYAEKICVGAEHQGSTVIFHQMNEQAKNRVDSLLNGLQNLSQTVALSFDEKNDLRNDERNQIATLQLSQNIDPSDRLTISNNQRPINEREDEIQHDNIDDDYHLEESISNNEIVEMNSDEDD